MLDYSLFYPLFRNVVAPEFAEMTDGEIDAFAAEAEIEISETAFGKRYPRAVALITAHLIAMSKRPGQMGGNAGTGQLKRTKVGDLEREFASSSQTGSKSQGSYELTTYGVEFLRLRKQILKTPKFVS